MRAAVLREYGAPLDVSSVEAPTAGAREALVRVRAVGLCATDLKLISGALSGNAPPPMIPGHEIAGELVEPVGELSAGQRVACYFYSSCGRCRWCSAQQPTLCPHAVRLGLERDGGLAEYVAVPVDSLLPFDERVSFAAGAVAMDAVAAPWGALHGQARVQAGDTVLVVGAGGLGANGVQIARDAGAAVAAVDLEAGHRTLALELGAEIAVEPEDDDAVRDWSRGGVDIALETSGSRSGFLTAAGALRPGGCVVCCGYQPGAEYGVDSGRLVLEQLVIRGSRSASPDESRAALSAVERGSVVPPIMEGLTLDSVNVGLDRIRARAVRGRVVVEL